MATPTSHPRPSPQKQSQSHLTPASAASPPAAPSSVHSTRTISSPQHAKKPSFTQQQQQRTNNSTIQYPSPNAIGGTPMSRSGTNNTAIGNGGGTPMARSATNGSVAMARTGTNNSSITGRTPITMRVGRATSAGSAATPAIGADSPSLTAAATMLMEGVMSGTSGGGAGASGGGMMAKGLTPADASGLGIGMTPLGGAGGSIVSGLAGLGERDQEEARKRRLEVISGLIGGRWGWVGQEGVERCARRIGFECLWEEGMGGTETRRVLSIAGEGVLNEVGFKGDTVVDVGLSLPASQDTVGRWVERGAEVLKRDLTGRDREKEPFDHDLPKEYVALEPFVKNLQRLRHLDHLSGEAANCFDAVDGIFKCLDRIFEWELRPEGDREAAEIKIMCGRGGRPQMHVNGCIGLSLQYWMDRRTLAHRDRERAEDQALTPDWWSILIECEECSAEVYTPIRTSDQWVSNEVSKAAGQQLDERHISTTEIDWLAVPVTLNSGEQIKQPDVRFLARFEPAIVVPLQLALQICNSVSWPIDQSSVMPTTYEALVFAEQDAQRPIQASPRVVERPSNGTRDQGSKGSQRQKLALYTQPADYAQMLTHIPFVHPMQIVNLLPSLRQWALVRSIMLRSFTAVSTSNVQHTNGTSPESDSKIANGIDSSSLPKYQTLEEEFADFLSSPAPTTIHNANSSTTTTPNGYNAPNETTIAINIAFAITPIPRFTIQFANPKNGGKLSSIAFSVGLNGIIESVIVEDGQPAAEPDADLAKMLKLREKVRKVIEIGESIGVVVEWLCGLQEPGIS